MIRVPTQGRYALRAMIDIGLHQDKGPVLRQDIARRQDISANYVAQIFRKLSSANLLVGIKGPGGGYKLAKPCEQIRASDILQAIEGPIALVHCVMNEDDETPCERTVHCATHRMWSRLSLTMRDYLDSVTLKDLMDESLQLDPHAVN
ncbi:MAG: Rrf2 family transcriptional regulator [Candidatus Atribacteria bacterium]|nr:MAG: Rrf2 family transcriptional regulator [Candidatus Atribacteria bacterium]